MKAKKIPFFGVSPLPFPFRLKKTKSLRLTGFKTPFLVVFDISAVFLFCYFFPRFLAQALGEGSPWISYFYTYGLGTLIFAMSSLWIFSRKYKYESRKKEELFWLKALSFGLLFVFLLHGSWIFLSISYPFKA